ncbi:MAG: hypothetical protein JO138_14290 [Acidobacteriaceae bacterium]|nr:hypothetical protein [Acidobacteriaceae bacterium]
MAQLSEAIARYHELLQSGYRDLDWAEGLQEQMRRRNLTDSGRPVSPVLRPHFITRRQLENLTRVAERLTAILDRVGLFCIESPSLLQRLRMLPAERMLATLPSGYSRLAVAARLEAHLHNGSLTLHGFDGCRSAGLAHADLLADLFLNLPIVKQFKRGNYKLSKLGGIRHLHAAILHAWKEFGGSHAPNIAIIEAGQQSLSANGEAAILAELFSRLGSPARPISLEELEYRGGHLSTRGFRIDIAFRRVLTRELLLRSDFSQPLLEAYQNHAVCLVNSFRSEVALRRGLFDPLTDETVIERFPAADRKLIRSFVPWTRIVSARKTNYRDEPINLLEFILRERERLILLPGDEGSEQRVFAGSDMSEQAWERALHHALNVPYVVQERDTAVCELFPVFAYGELCMRTLEVTVHPHVLNGEVQGAVAALKPGNGAGVAQLGIAPVLVLEQH